MKAAREAAVTSSILDELRNDVRAGKSARTRIGHVLRRIRLALALGPVRPHRKNKQVRRTAAMAPNPAGRVTHRRRPF